MRKEYCSTEAGHVIRITLDNRGGALIPGTPLLRPLSRRALVMPPRRAPAFFADRTGGRPNRASPIEQVFVAPMTPPSAAELRCVFDCSAPREFGPARQGKIPPIIRSTEALVSDSQRLSGSVKIVRPGIHQQAADETSLRVNIYHHMRRPVFFLPQYILSHDQIYLKYY